MSTSQPNSKPDGSAGNRLDCHNQSLVWPNQSMDGVIRGYSIRIQIKMCRMSTLFCIVDIVTFVLMIFDFRFELKKNNKIYMINW